MSLELLCAYSSSDGETSESDDDDKDVSSKNPKEKPLYAATQSESCKSSLEPVVRKDKISNQTEKVGVCNAQSFTSATVSKNIPSNSIDTLAPEIVPMPEPGANHEMTEVNENIVYIPWRKQIIPGRFLLPTEDGTVEPAGEEYNAGQTIPILPGMGTREFKRLKSAVWKDMTTTGNAEKQDESSTETPVTVVPQLDETLWVEEGCDTESEYSEKYHYYYHYFLHQQYLEYYQKHAGSGTSIPTFGQWSKQGTSASGPAPPPPPPPPPNLRQKSFEELVEQDRQLNEFFGALPTEYTMQRAAFKSDFRGTKTYRENNKQFNPSHFNQLTKGARNHKKNFPRTRSVFEDKDRYIPERDLPENREPKSNKQRKKEEWRARMKYLASRNSS